MKLRDAIMNSDVRKAEFTNEIGRYEYDGKNDRYWRTDHDTNVRTEYPAQWAHKLTNWEPV